MTGSRTCQFCGQSHRKGRNNCPAWNKVCNSCGGRNHFKAVCKRQVHSVQTEVEVWLKSVK